MNQAVFLDRDGVINEVQTKRVTFVNKPSDLYLLDGVKEAVRLMNTAGFFVFIVTNQGGVGLGYMKESMLVSIHKKMVEQFASSGATIDGVAYCPHKPHEGCPCRKPEAQMIQELAEKHGIDLRTSIMVGDREPDIQAGKKAGCQTVLVNARGEDDFGADAVFSTLLEAVPWILKKRK